MGCISAAADKNAKLGLDSEQSPERYGLARSQVGFFLEALKLIHLKVSIEKQARSSLCQEVQPPGRIREHLPCRGCGRCPEAQICLRAKGTAPTF